MRLGLLTRDERGHVGVHTRLYVEHGSTMYCNQLVFAPVYDVNSPMIFQHAEDLACASKVIVH